ncbi:MAG: TonB family protein [Limisphaerales bacterium]|jgi:TonB family protein
MSHDKVGVPHTYAGAAWLITIGVVLSWVILKQNTVQAGVDLPKLPQIAMLDPTKTQTTFLQQAQVAFAAGRITRPQGDSALEYYQQQLELTPGNLDAQAGIKRVTAFLLNGAEKALGQQDWSGAHDLAQQALALKKDNPSAKSILARISEHDSIASLIAVAHEQISAQRLTQPQGDNALASYREVLRLDPTHTGALQGLELLAQRLASLAQTEAFADRTQKAHELIALAKTIAPQAPGIEAAEQLANEWTSITKDQAVKQDIMAAAAATQADRLLSTDIPGQYGALELYQSALDQDRSSEAALAGRDYVIVQLIDRAWIQLANEDFRLAENALLAAEEAGGEVAAAMTELDFLKRRQRNRAGIFDFDEMLPISSLEVRRQVQPSLSNNVEGGAVQLEFTVDEEGNVQNIEIVEAGNVKLGEAAVLAIARWRFFPHQIDGRAIPVRTGVRLRIET